MKHSRSICTRIMSRISTQKKRINQFQIQFKEYLALKIAGSGTLYRRYFLLLCKDGSWRLIRNDSDVEHVRENLQDVFFFADIERFFLADYWDWISKHLEDNFEKCLRTVKKRLDEIEKEIQVRLTEEK